MAINLQAQLAGKDSLPSDPAYTEALRQYHAYLNPEPGLYNGSEYVDYQYLMRNGHPFFGDDKMRKGTLWYDGIFYQDVLMQFDEVKGYVIINDAYEIYKISLNNSLVDRFTLENSVFINLTDSLNPSQPRNGYYEQLYKGRISLLKREKKEIHEDASSVSDGVQRDILSSVSYYIKKGESYYPVNNTNSLLQALKDKKSDVKKFIRKNGLSIRKDKENALIKISSWYDGL